MKRFETSVIVGIALVAAGILFLLQNFNLLGPLADIIWSLVFATGGVVFLAIFVRDRERWWALIPGMALLGIGLLVLSGRVLPGLAAPFGGALFLAMLALSFVLIYLTNGARWWAIIPGGTLLTLAVIAGLNDSLPGLDLGWVLFFGLAITFAIVAVAPTPEGAHHWAFIPSGVLLLLALIIGTSLGPIFNLIWPALLIVAGAYLALRATRGRRESLSPALPRGGSVPPPANEPAPKEES